MPKKTLTKKVTQKKDRRQGSRQVQHPRRDTALGGNISSPVPNLPVEDSSALACEPKTTAAHAQNACNGTSTEKAGSSQQQLVELGRKWKQLVDQRNVSLSELAKQAGCSKSLVRDLIMLASLPQDLQTAYLEGKIGRKKVLEMVRTRRKASQPTQAVSPGHKAKPTQPEAPPPVMSEHDRQRKIAEGAQLVIDWFHSIDVPSCYWESIFNQVNLGLYGGLRWLFAPESPSCKHMSDELPVEVIKRCRPKGEEERSMPDVLNNVVRWLASWIQTILPDRKLMKESLDRAERILIREAWKASTSW